MFGLSQARHAASASRRPTRSKAVAFGSFTKAYTVDLKRRLANLMFESRTRSFGSWAKSFECGWANGPSVFCFRLVRVLFFGGIRAPMTRKSDGGAANQLMSTKQTAPTRILSIDILRGVVIILMMLDHVRERFYMHVRTGDPIYETIGPALFFTRYIAHFCAPIFIFLAGLSAWLNAHPPQGQYRSPAGFLFKRGLVIIAIEIFLYYILWADSYPTYLFLQVLFAIGFCMIALAVVSGLSQFVLCGLGLAIVFGHNLLVPIDFTAGHIAFIPWAILHDGGELGQIGPLTISLSYPVLPWFGVILLGYSVGPIFAPSVSKAQRGNMLVVGGLACLAILLVLRGSNIYGETAPWSIQETLLRTVMDFLNFTKYPPSLDYLLITLGIGAFALAFFERFSGQGRLLDALRLYGSVPMFLYVTHLYALLAAYWILFPIFGANRGARFGFEAVWWIWVGAGVLVIGMYFPA